MSSICQLQSERHKVIIHLEGLGFDSLDELRLEIQQWQPSYVMMRADEIIFGDQATSEMVIRQPRELSTMPKTIAHPQTERANLHMLWAFATGQAPPAFGLRLRLCKKMGRMKS